MVKRDPIIRFWEKVDKLGPIPEGRMNLGPCWLWMAVKTTNGYGRFNPNRKQYAAHRFAYEITKGVIPDGKQLDHLCRNTSCVNPDHLEPVTGRENLFRSETTQASIHKAKTHCLKGHEFTKGNTYINPSGFRQCKACHRERDRKFKAKRKA